NPNTPEVVPNSPVWPELSVAEQRYLTINSASFEDRYHRYTKMKFWNEYVDRLNNRLFNITSRTVCLTPSTGKDFRQQLLPVLLFVLSLYMLHNFQFNVYP
ncbi:unnamed protein product, partial [Owenia fusiformis]